MGRNLASRKAQTSVPGQSLGKDPVLQAQGGEARGLGRHWGGLWFPSIHSRALGAQELGFCGSHRASR